MMGRRLLLVFLQIAAVIVLLVSVLQLATLLFLVKDTLDEVTKANSESVLSGRNTALVSWCVLVGKECLTLAVAMAAFRYASQERRHGVRTT